FTITSLPHPVLYSFPTRRSSDLHHDDNRDHDDDAMRRRLTLILLVLAAFAVPALAHADNGNGDNGCTAGANCAIAINQTSNSALDRKSTRLNSSHSQISYAVFCL